MDELTEGARVEVEITNNAPIGGSTQKASFVVDELRVDRIVGTDPSWGDECEVTAWGTDDPQYSDAGKSGAVESVKVMDTTDDGCPIHGTGTEVLTT